MNNSFNNYFQHAPLTDFWFWVWPLISLLVCYGLGAVLNQTIVKPKSVDNLKHQFYFHRAHIFAGFGVMALGIGWIGWNWSHGLYLADNSPVKYMELSHLLIILISGVYSIVWFIQLQRFYTKQRIHNIIRQATTPTDHQRLIVKAKEAFDWTKRWVLLLLVGGIGFAFYIQSPKTLISIIIDDSGSMGEDLNVGSEALAKTMAKLNTAYTDVVITSFGTTNPSASDPYSSFSELATVNKADSLDAHTNFVDNPLDVSDYVLTLKSKKNKGYGLNQAIWQNFLETRSRSERAGDYKNKIMLIVTDGIEYSREWYDTKLCTPKYGFGDFYNNKVYFIDLLRPGTEAPAELNGFRAMMKECFGPESRRNGFEGTDYMNALNEFFQPYELDRGLPWVLFILCVLYFIVIFIGIKVSMSELEDKRDTINQA